MSSHRFGDSRRAQEKLVEAHRYLTALSPETFATEVLSLLSSFERTKPLREILRASAPDGKYGYVAEDLDLMVRVFGARYQSDAQGVFRLVEVKWSRERDEPYLLKPAQQMTFGLLDQLLSSSAEADRYDGFYVVTHTHHQLLEGRVWIQRLGERSREVTPSEFVAWAAFEDRRVV